MRADGRGLLPWDLAQRGLRYLAAPSARAALHLPPEPPEAMPPVLMLHHATNHVTGAAVRTRTSRNRKRDRPIHDPRCKPLIHLFVTELIGLMMMTLALKRRRKKSRSCRLQMTSTPENKP